MSRVALEAKDVERVKRAGVVCVDATKRKRARTAAAEASGTAVSEPAASGAVESASACSRRWDDVG